MRLAALAAALLAAPACAVYVMEIAYYPSGCASTPTYIPLGIAAGCTTTQQPSPTGQPTTVSVSYGCGSDGTPQASEYLGSTCTGSPLVSSSLWCSVFALKSTTPNGPQTGYVCQNVDPANLLALSIYNSSSCTHSGSPLITIDLILNSCTAISQYTTGSFVLSVSGGNLTESYYSKSNTCNNTLETPVKVAIPLGTCTLGGGSIGSAIGSTGLAVSYSMVGGSSSGQMAALSSILAVVTLAALEKML